MKNRIMFVFWLLGGHPQIFLAIALAILLALVVRSHAHGADLVVESDKDPWVQEQYLIVELIDGEHYIFDQQGNRIASYHHYVNNEPPAGIQAAGLPETHPSDWINMASYSYRWWEDGSGNVTHGEEITAGFCMAWWGCDDPDAWPMPMSHEESPKLYLPFIGK